MRLTKGLYYIVVGLFATIEFCGQAAHISNTEYQGFVQEKNNMEKQSYHSRNRRDTDISVIRTLVQTVTQNLQVDILFVMDRSAGIGQQKFYLFERKFARSFISHYLYVSPDRVRVGAITFGHDVTLAFDRITRDPLLKCQLVESDEMWSKVLYYTNKSQSYGTNISGALQMAKGVLANGRKSRPSGDLKQVIVILTDGELDNPGPAQVVADDLKDDGILIYGVGIGDWLRNQTIMALTTTERHYAAEDKWRLLLPELGNDHIASAYQIIGMYKYYNGLYHVFKKYCYCCKRCTT